VIKFASTCKVLQNLTNEINPLQIAIGDLPSLGTGVALYDGIYEATTKLLGSTAKKMIVVFTAGNNNSSAHAHNETIEFALRTNSPVYILGCTTEIDTSLAAIARITGGKYYSYSTWGNLETMVQDLIKRINNFYVFVHTSTDPTTNGIWRTVDFTLNYANKMGNDVGHYLPPAEGRDPWITISSRPDSVGLTAKFARPGETFTYTITYGNYGFESCQNCSIKSVLPDSISAPFNIKPTPTRIEPKALIWNADILNPGEIRVINYDVTVHAKMPPFFFLLYDTVSISCESSDDRNPDNNLDIDTVFVYPGEPSPPAISAHPKEVPVNSPVTLSITTQTPLKRWDIWIEYPPTSTIGLDTDEFNDQIKNKIEPLMPMAPDDSLVIDPQFTNTKIWGSDNDGEQRETYRAILDFTDWFNRTDTVSTSFIVYAEYSTSLINNRFNPGDGSLRLIYNLIHDSHVKISVFNVAGEFVKELVNKDETAGEHYAEWNGYDKNGRMVGSDVYVILSEIGPQKEWLKVIVLW